MKLRIGFSPCPNDTFIFDALIHQRLDTEALSFEPVIEDVETLNQLALKGELEISKLSFHALGHAANQYQLLDAGSALGRGCGPLLIAKKKLEAHAANINPLKIAIPGQLTTANFLLSMAFPEATNKIPMVFSAIEQAVLNSKVDAGLIIHENRFTYEAKGLKKIIDLGEYWESTTGFPIPLGGIAIKNALSEKLKWQVNRLLRQSVEYAFEHPEIAMPYIRSLAQEMDESVMKQHIELYVNEYSVDLGIRGREAVSKLFMKAVSSGIIPAFDIPGLFIRNA